ncbi:hypothetical protein [Methylobacterium sp. R2-1]|uniref:hypothetical protein n=1 Tax=Methylobacterium sp. R2-1 TaxID=2587064 RepID=UPI0016211FF7|nr:hypothetical protein [Methylobacterium sp. R2-1]MBB2965094.1 RPA family protein [Methylobacterium sp. R2-1]
MTKPWSDPRIQCVQQRANDLWEAEARYWDEEAMKLFREQEQVRDERERDALRAEEAQYKDRAEYCRSRIGQPL